jgi:hypothetical protein
MLPFKFGISSRLSIPFFFTYPYLVSVHCINQQKTNYHTFEFPAETTSVTLQPNNSMLTTIVMLIMFK